MESSGEEEFGLTTGIGQQTSKFLRVCAIKADDKKNVKNRLLVNITSRVKKKTAISKEKSVLEFFVFCWSEATHSKPLLLDTMLLLQLALTFLVELCW